MKQKSIENQNEVLIISAVNPTRAYSGIKYLFNNIRKGAKTTLWCAVPMNQINDLKSWGGDTYSFFEGFIGKIPKIRFWFMKLKGFFVCIRYRNKTIICHDLVHYRGCYIVKKIFPKTKLIHYCTEIYNEKSVKFQRKLMKYYSCHSKIADYTIECNDMRCEYRVKKFKLDMPTGVILNTLPKSEIIDYREEVKLINNPPIIINSGGIFSCGDWDIIIEALTYVKSKYFVEFCCYGNQSAIIDFKQKCEKYLPQDSYAIIEGLGREDVLSHVARADIGIMYYDPEWSINTKYAAPTKFFEYMALGLPVVCSKNDSLVDIVDKKNIGVTMKTNDAKGMGNALALLISDLELRKKMSSNARSIFDNEFCYELQSKKALEAIKNIIGIDSF